MTEIHLSPRELQVLHGIACGFTLDYIAHRLDISPRTVKNYAASVREKLEVNNNAAAVAKSMALGLIFIFVFNNRLTVDSSG